MSENEYEKEKIKEQKALEKQKSKEEKKKAKEERKKAKKEKNENKKANKFIQVVKNKWLKETSFTILLIVAVISAYVAINMVMKALDIQDIDMTEEGLYTVSEESKKELNDINKEVKIYVFGYDENASVVDLAKQYSKFNDKISVEVVSTDERPELASTYGVESDDEVLVFVCDGRNITVDSSDFYDYNYTTYEEYDTTEQAITNSILAVTLEDAPKIYFLTGHNEYNLTSYLASLNSQLENEVNEVETLDLLVKNEIPEDCSTLAIVNPTTDFTDFETELIKNYINKGGNILWLKDYSSTGTLENAQKILDLYGVTPSNDGIIIEQDKSAMLMQTSDIILPQINEDSEITSDISVNGKVVLADSGKLEIKSDEELEELGVTSTTLLSTSEQAFWRTDFTKSSLSPSADEEVKEYTIGALLTKTISKSDENEETDEDENVDESEETEEDSITSNLVIYANAFFATDQAITIQSQSIPMVYLYNNKDLVMNSISYLTNRTETITIRKTYSTISYTATSQENLVVVLIIFIAPLVIIAVGLIVWIRRKHRK